MRTALAAILLVLLLPAVMVANAATWTTRTVLDESAFAAQVGAVLETPTLEEAIARRATAAVIATLDRAPGRLVVVGQAILGLATTPTRAQIEAALETRIRAALADPAVRAARDDAVTASHRFVIDAAREDDDLVVVEGSQVVLDLRPVVERAAAAVDDRLPRAGLASVAPADARIVLADARTAETIGRAVDVLETLRLVVPLAILAILVLLVILAHRRTRALAIAGVAIMLAGLASLAVAWFGQGAVGDITSDPVVSQVARDVYAAFLSPLVLQSALIAAGGGLLAVVGWIVLQRRGARHPVDERGETPAWPTRVDPG